MICSINYSISLFLWCIYTRTLSGNSSPLPNLYWNPCFLHPILSSFKLIPFFWWKVSSSRGSLKRVYYELFLTQSVSDSVGSVLTPTNSPTFQTPVGILQFSSVTQSLRTPQPHGLQYASFSVNRQLLELAQIHVHRVGDAIQPSHPLSSRSPPAFNLSQHQGLFLWVSSSHQAAKVSYNWIQIWHYLELVWTPNRLRTQFHQTAPASDANCKSGPLVLLTSYKVRRVVGCPTIPLFRFDNLLEWYF